MKKAGLRKRSEVGQIANGVLQVRGDFYLAHRYDIQHLIDHTVQLVQESHPFERVMSRSENEEGLVVEVTSSKLAERLGHVLSNAYGGKTVYEMLGDTGQARVFWERNGITQAIKKAEEKMKKKGKKKKSRK